jgi:hypothetical protein
LACNKNQRIKNAKLDWSTKNLLHDLLQLLDGSLQIATLSGRKCRRNSSVVVFRMQCNDLRDVSCPASGIVFFIACQASVIER